MGTMDKHTILSEFDKGQNYSTTTSTEHSIKSAPSKKQRIG